MLKNNLEKYLILVLEILKMKYKIDKDSAYLNFGGNNFTDIAPSKFCIKSCKCTNSKRI